MRAVGELVGEGADEIEQTPYDYPMRNVYQVSKSGGVFLLTGGDGALEEALPALIDYGLPVGIVDGTGEAATALRMLLQVFPEWEELLMFSPNVDTLVEEYCERVRQMGDAKKGQ